MARSRNPRSVEISGALRRACACLCDSQFPARIPCVFALFTRLMPAANSGASNPLSAASAASLRIADRRDPRLSSAHGCGSVTYPAERQ